MTKPKIALLVAALSIVLGAGYWYRTTSGTAAKQMKAPPPAPVSVAVAMTESIPVLLDVVGRAEAYEGVTIKARVDGQVASVAYSEGQHVKAGEVLLRLDPGDFAARLAQAEASLARDEAQLAKAKADVSRYVSLKERGFVSDEKVNEIRTAEAAAAATVAADRAAVELARLQLSYTTIKAPFAGIVGARLVFPGSAVKVNDTALAVVNRVRPLYVTFSLPERHLATLRSRLAAGPLPVNVTLPGNAAPAFPGKLRFIDNAVDTASGTIQMKALLENAEEKLTPGQFLNVSLALATLDKAVTVPAEAVQQGAEGNFLFAVKADNTVEVRKIEVLTTYAGRAAIGQGLTAGETVVTDGQLRLKQGSAVQFKSAPAEAVAPPRN